MATLDLDELKKLGGSTYSFPAPPTPQPIAAPSASAASTNPPPPATPGQRQTAVTAAPAPSPSPLGMLSGLGIGGTLGVRPAGGSGGSITSGETPCGCEAGDYRPECWDCGTPGDPGGDTCGPGFHFDPDYNGCVRDDGTEGPPPTTPSGCPPGQTFVGRFGRCLDDCQGLQTRDDQGNCVGDPGGNQPPTGGGGGPTAPRPPNRPPLQYSPGTLDFQADLEAMIRAAMNAPSRYTPEALQALYGQISRQASGRILRGERAVKSNAAQRGMSRAGSTQAALRGVRDAAESQRGQSIVEVQMTKINADHADKMAALDRAQRYLDSLRDSEYRLMIASEQRSQFDANLALGYAQLEQQRELLMAQLQSEWDRLRAIIGFGALQDGV